MRTISPARSILFANTTKRDEPLADVLAWHRSAGALVPRRPNPKYQPDAVRAEKKKGNKKRPAKE